MGYCYGRDKSGKQRLACDSCGTIERTRKRTCPFKVSGLPYCPAPALCVACYAKRGGKKLHADCEAPAKAAQAEDDACAAILACGEYRVAAAWGDWHPTVPEGWVGVLLRNGHLDERLRLALKDEYDRLFAGPRPRGGQMWQFDFEALAPWKDGPGEHMRRKAG